jgi:hypothetical protein
MEALQAPGRRLARRTYIGTRARMRVDESKSPGQDLWPRGVDAAVVAGPRILEHLDGVRRQRDKLWRLKIH